MKGTFNVGEVVDLVLLLIDRTAGGFLVIWSVSGYNVRVFLLF